MGSEVGGGPIGGFFPVGTPPSQDYGGLVLNRQVLELLGDGYYKIDFPKIVGTGSAFDTELSVGFAHMLRTIEIKHTTASAAADATNLATVIIDKRRFPNVRETLRQKTDTFHSLVFEDIRYWNNLMNYVANVNAVATEEIYITFIVKPLNTALRG